MKIFVTGATGYIGQQLSIYLANQGHYIVALVRNLDKSILISHPNIHIYQGDLSDVSLLIDGMQGCDQVYHLAALAGVWSKDPNAFYNINVVGTNNVLDAALHCKVKKVVVTSTGGTLGPSPSEKVEVTEAMIPSTYFNDYERTKAQSEDEIRKRSKKGQHIVIVNPTRLYGPGQLSVSNIGTKMIDQYMRGKWRFLPGDGHGIGNYVFIDDVVKGHELAMLHGRRGERYILGGENASYREYLDVVAACSGKRYKVFSVPVGLLMIFAWLQSLKPFFGGTPKVTKAWVKRFLYHWVINCDKAKNELHYTPLPLKEGIQRTVDWLKENEQ